jgi:hypothetical protein
MNDVAELSKEGMKTLMIPIVNRGRKGSANDHAVIFNLHSSFSHHPCFAKKKFLFDWLLLNKNLSIPPQFVNETTDSNESLTFKKYSRLHRLETARTTDFLVVLRDS